MDFDPILSRAKQELSEWFDANTKMCVFKKPIYDQLYYTTAHGQAWYILKFFPAYFAEYKLMYTDLQNIGIENPVVASLGCGCFVDAAAAAEVFDDQLSYVGYDKNDWLIKAGEYDFKKGALGEASDYNPDTNVIVFPRSIGDLLHDLESIAAKIQAANLTNRNIYVCSSMRVNNRQCTTDEGFLNQFVGYFCDYTSTIVGEYVPAKDVAECTFDICDKIEGWNHAEASFANELLNRCKGINDCSENCEDDIKPLAARRLKNIAYRIVKLSRV